MWNFQTNKEFIYIIHVVCSYSFLVYAILPISCGTITIPIGLGSTRNIGVSGWWWCLTVVNIYLKKAWGFCWALMVFLWKTHQHINLIFKHEAYREPTSLRCWKLINLGVFTSNPFYHQWFRLIICFSPTNFFLHFPI